ncbi:MAG: hypothetical protein M1823_005406 [Watsoniomyces obsoletus]|nr:MAG: hypothetical protein M1823_005406 [Watsoniomyces obsoletus]
MFAARDQENLTHGHRVIASNKPLNQSGANVPAPPPKTPGLKTVKTPFRAPLHDENAGAPTGKPIPLKSEGKPGGGGLGKNVFVTPFGPRNRAPLGQKTTNAKAKPFQTPGAPGINNNNNKDGLEGVLQEPAPAKTTSHPLDTESVGVRPLDKKNDEEEEREIEYMPPKPNDLPDPPDVIPADISYSPLRGANLTRGWYSTYCNPVGEDGLTLFEREQETQSAKVDTEILTQTEKLLEEIPSLEEIARAEADDEDNTIRPMKPGFGPPAGKRAPPSTISSKQAASMLSKTATVTRRVQPISSTARTTTTTANVKPRLPFSNLSAMAIGGRKKQITVHQQPAQATNPSEMRHAAATAASRSTLGYAKGRVVSGELSRGRIPPSSSVVSSARTTNASAGTTGLNPPRATREVKQPIAASAPMTGRRPGIPARSASNKGGQPPNKMITTSEQQGPGRMRMGMQQMVTEGKKKERMKVSEYFYFLGTSDDEDEEGELVIDSYEGLDLKKKEMKELDISPGEEVGDEQNIDKQTDDSKKNETVEDKRKKEKEEEIDI